MKSLSELQELKDQTLREINLRMQNGGTKIIVCMGTCGIAAGARETMRTIVGELKNKNINYASVLLSGCDGSCEEEPVVKVVEPTGEETVYIRVDEEGGKRIVNEHVIGHKVIDDMVR